jgi:hypothetical protein
VKHIGIVSPETSSRTLSGSSNLGIAVALLLALGFVTVQTVWLNDALRGYDRFSRASQQKADGAPVSAEDPPATIFGEDDPYMWVHYVREMEDSGDWRLHHTTIDNVPEGRAVHWSSGFAWYLALGGWVLARA